MNLLEELKKMYSNIYARICLVLLIIQLVLLVFGYWLGSLAAFALLIVAVYIDKERVIHRVIR